ncbi:hypothetical protein [Oceanithermus sp.]
MKGIRYLFAAAALLAVLAACDGSLGAYVTVSATGAEYSAYQVPGDAWRMADDPENFDLWAFGPYQVAVKCGDTLHLYSLTAGEVTALQSPCEENGSTSFSVSFDVSAVNGAASADIYYKNGLDSQGATSGTFNITNGVSGQQDVVLVAENSSGDPIAARMVSLEISEGGSYNISLSAQDTGNLITGSLDAFSAQVPPGWASTLALIGSVTPNGTLVLSSGLSSGGGSFTSYSFASHDLASITAREQLLSPTKSVSQVITSSAPGAGFTAQLPAPFDATISHEALPLFSGLGYTAGDLLGYHLEIDWGSYKLSAFVSSGYLENNTSYQLPDLTSYPAFSDFMPGSGDNVKASAEAVMSSLSLKELSALPLNRMPREKPGLSVRLAGDEEKFVVP